MPKAKRVHSTPPLSTPISQVDATSRRRFLSNAAGIAASGSVLALAAIPPASAAAAPAVALDPAAPDADAELLDLEERIFEHHAAAKEYNTEIERLDAIVRSEARRLYDEALAAEVRKGCYLMPDERWSGVSSVVSTMPESRECERLIELQDAHWNALDRLQQKMWAIPAHTPEGRRAKVLVLLGAVSGEEWQHTDDRTEFSVLQARNLLIEFIGGDPGEQMREQFS
jgi:hypothetical protein